MTWATNLWLPFSVSTAEPRRVLPSHHQLIQILGASKHLADHPDLQHFAEFLKMGLVEQVEKVAFEGQRLKAWPRTWFRAYGCRFAKASRSRDLRQPLKA